MAFPAFAALMGASSTLEAFGAIQGAENQVRAAKVSARSLDLQADEVLRRAEINIETVRLQGEELEGAQVSALARGGVDVSSGSALQVIEEGALNIRKEQANIRMQAEFEAKQLRTQAKQIRKKARRGRGIAGIKAIGSLLTGAGEIVGNMPKTSQKTGGVAPMETIGPGTQINATIDPRFGRIV